MPKNKTHSGTAKRVKVTGGGKLLRQHANRRHQLEHKSEHAAPVGWTGTTEIAPADVKRVRRLLGR